MSYLLHTCTVICILQTQDSLRKSQNRNSAGEVCCVGGAGVGGPPRDCCTHGPAPHVPSGLGGPVSQASTMAEFTPQTRPPVGAAYAALTSCLAATPRLRCIASGGGAWRVSQVHAAALEIHSTRHLGAVRCRPGRALSHLFSSSECLWAGTIFQHAVSCLMSVSHCPSCLCTCARSSTDFQERHATTHMPCGHRSGRPLDSAAVHREHIQ